MKIIFGSSDEINRKAVESKSTDILMSPEGKRNKDFMKSRNSGLNHVLCGLANKNNVAIGFDFNEILLSKDFERADLLGRMMFNVQLCGKYNVRMIVCNSAKNHEDIRSESGLKAFARALGMKKFSVKRFEY